MGGSPELNQIHETFPEHRGIHAANKFYERAALEQEAQRLINNWSPAEAPPIEYDEHKNNGRTALWEALTASGHLSKVEINGSLEEIENQMMARLLNGWDDSLPQHEKDRRFSEIVNLLYGRKVRADVVAGELPEKTAILEISDYPEALRDQRLGYRDDNKKGMVRSTYLENLGGDQYRLTIEQVSRSNGTWRSTFGFINACGIYPENQGKPSDIVALDTPMIYSTRDYTDGVVDVMRLLDRHSGHGVLYGDTDRLAISKHAAYEQLRQESQRREAEVEIYIEELAEIGQKLDKLVGIGRISQQERTERFEEQIDKIIEVICVLEPSYAAVAYGEKAAPSFQEASMLVARGRLAEAKQVLIKNEHLREDPVFCGGGGRRRRRSTLGGLEDDLGLNLNTFEERVEKGKDSWSWKKGVCAVKTCHTRPGRVEVGPCSICRSCQAKFDRGEDPTKDIKVVSLPKKKRPFQLFETAKPEAA